MTSTADILALLGSDPENAEQLPRLERLLREGARVVPFVGAGMSASFGFPLWDTFLLELATAAESSGYQGVVDAIRTRLERLEYEEAAGDLRDVLGASRFNDALAARFGNGPLTQTTHFGAVAELTKFPNGPIITTNFDRVVERAFASNGKVIEAFWSRSLQSRGPQSFREERLFLLKLHGDFDDETDRVLTLDEYQKAYDHGSGAVDLTLPLPDLLRLVMKMRFCLFLGCSLKQDRTMRLLRMLCDDDEKLRHFAVVEKLGDRGAHARRTTELANLSICPIWYPTGRHDLIQPLLEHLADVIDEGLIARGNDVVRARAPHTPLPQVVGTTIGRDTEIADIVALTRTERLVTILGAGGTGKSRVAIAVTGAIEERYRNGRWFVQLAELAPAADKERVLTSRIARLVGIAEQKHPPLDSLVEFFSRGPSLLVLDNCEHLVESCRELLDGLLNRCASLTVLATSRRQIYTGTSIECVYGLNPLPVPAPDLVAIDQLEKSPSVQLFLERAERGRTWKRTPARIPVVARLCRALEGIPLAIEVAAARLDVRSVEQMEEGIGQLLTSFGSAQASGIGRSWRLDAALEWSFQLLGPGHRRALQIMTIFDGGWTEKAADAVVGNAGGAPILEILQELSANSLLVSTDAEEKRFRYLEPIRQAAAATWPADERATVAILHARFFVALAETAAPELTKGDQMQWLDRLQADVENFRAVARWAVETRNAEMGLRLMAALWRFTEIRGFLREGRERCNAALAIEGAASHEALYSKVLSGAGMLAYRQADFAEAERMFRASLAIDERRQDAAGMANALNDLGNIANQNGRFDEAKALLQRALAFQIGLQDARQIAVTQFNLGAVAMCLEDNAEAERLLHDSLNGFIAQQNTRDSAFPYHALAQLSVATGQLQAARKYGAESLCIRKTLKDTKGEAETRRTLAWAALSGDRFDDARKHLVQSMSLANGVGDARGLSETLELMGLLYEKTGHHLDAVEVLTGASLIRAGKSYALPKIRTRLRDEALARASAALPAADATRAVAAGTAVRFPASMESLVARLKATVFSAGLPANA